MVGKADTTPNAKHCALKALPNLYVLKTLQSLKSRGYVTSTFSWGWHYWYLTNEGINYLRDYLNLPDEIVPATLKKPKAPTRIPGPAGAGRGTGRGGDKKVGPGGDFQPNFRGGRGGGRGGYRRDEGAPRGGSRGRF